MRFSGALKLETRWDLMTAPFIRNAVSAAGIVTPTALCATPASSKVSGPPSNSPKLRGDRKRGQARHWNLPSEIHWCKSNPNDGRRVDE